MYILKINPSDDWHEILNQSITDANDLISPIFITNKIYDIQKVVNTYPLKINPYYFSLIKTIDDAVWKQCVPNIKEIEDDYYEEDPLSEEFQSPVPNLIHRYPNRVLFLVSNQCAVFCRYCMRKRKTGKNFVINEYTISSGIKYIEQNENIQDVILSGGDPLLLEDDKLEDILKKIRKISHVEIIRIHTRVPCVLPQRITINLVGMLKNFHPLYINTHFNHPCEITVKSSYACELLANSGIPLGNQTVLLKGVNDNYEIIKKLMQELLKIRVKPYYIHHPDLVKGTSHFRITIETGLQIIKKLRGNISGLAVPQYMIDMPGGEGKIPLLPDYIKDKCNGQLVIENFKGKLCQYPLEY